MVITTSLGRSADYVSCMTSEVFKLSEHDGYKFTVLTSLRQLAHYTSSVRDEFRGVTSALYSLHSFYAELYSEYQQIVGRHVTSSRIT